MSQTGFSRKVGEDVGFMLAERMKLFITGRKVVEMTRYSLFFVINCCFYKSHPGAKGLSKIETNVQKEWKC